MQRLGNLCLNLAKTAPAVARKIPAISRPRLPAGSGFAARRSASGSAQAVAAKQDAYRDAPITEQHNSQPEQPAPLANAPSLNVEWPHYHSARHIAEAQPLLQKISNIPLVQSLIEQESVVCKEFFWPVESQWAHLTLDTILYDAYSGSNDLPLVPLVFPWKPGCTPEHLNHAIFESCISSSIKQGHASLRAPGVTIVQYMGSGLGMSGVADGVSGGLPTIHPGVLTTVIDHLAICLIYSNMPKKFTFTANIQLEYLAPVLADCCVVVDAWITSMEGRKTVVSGYMADALTGQVYVKSKTLFVSAT